MRPYKLPSANGFTLIELIVGIVVLAISLMVITSFLAPQALKSVDPIYEVRSAELGSSLMNEILGKSFDENSDHTGGGLWRCGDTGQLSCTAASDYGPEGEDRGQYNDVDDYHTNGNFITIDDSLGVDLSNVYRNFSYRVNVDSSEHGINAAKRIDVIIRAPNGIDYAFSAFRWNY
ncbi:type IV pilus modification PilV family protein [Agarivorans aestuarii]|uniref:type IV pilus modification PilV family protein n=1 Tax=Agarivorans aestuarii TaxID=1563703 RepID=UPI001C804207|nr:prepilin-type N-terminal cleavage/methylation domain-containing protein [Agarivorans aestuarii]